MSLISSTSSSTVLSSLEGQRLDRVLAMLTGRSRAQVERILADGREVAGKVKVTEGQVIEIELPDASGSQALAADDSVLLELLHVDDDVIVINKQPGLVVHRATGHAIATLVQGVMALYPEIAAIGAPARPGIVHRLGLTWSGGLFSRGGDGHWSCYNLWHANAHIDDGGSRPVNDRTGADGASRF